MGQSVSIYVLVDPRDQEVRYVGATRRPLTTRLRAHIKEASEGRSNLRKCSWINDLVQNGLKPEIVVVSSVDESCWENEEKRMISYFFDCGSKLTNLTDGGRACLFFSDSRVRLPMIAETREKISHANTGRVMSEATRKKISARMMGNSYRTRSYGRESWRSSNE